jgi:SAM-dependent methyltransferase
MSSIAERFFPEIAAGGFSRIDGTIQFYQRINALLEPHFVVLDLGAGRGANFYDDPISYRRKLINLKGKVREVIGADIDPIVKQNPGIDRAILLEPSRAIPLVDKSVHFVISDCTFEHIEDPAFLAGELDRILAPGGWICARTPNRRGYIGLANRLIPERFRMRILHLTQPDRKEEDTFRTFYRLNTIRLIKRYFDPARFNHFSFSWNVEPAYHANSRLLFALFFALDTITPSPLRSILLIFMQKKG